MPTWTNQPTSPNTAQVASALQIGLKYVHISFQGLKSKWRSLLRLTRNLANLKDRTAILNLSVRVNALRIHQMELAMMLPREGTQGMFITFRCYLFHDFNFSDNHCLDVCKNCMHFYHCFLLFSFLFLTSLSFKLFSW
jgi:hypothetical protein